jgi:hypothetical protein
LLGGTLGRRIFKSRKLSRKITAILLAFSTLATITSITAASAATVNTTSNTAVSTGGGGAADSAACAAGSVMNGVYATTTSFDSSYALSDVYGICTALNSAGTAATGSSADVGGFGTTTGTMSSTTCAPTTTAIVGAIVYTTTNGYASGVKLICATLPDVLSSSQTTQASVFGSTGANTTQSIYCPTGEVADGLYVYAGSIEDKFGMECGYISGATQSTLTETLSTSSSTYPYSNAPGMSTTGGNGTGGVTYTVSNGTAANCALSSSAANATLTATSIGTCTITATKASDTNWASTTSTATYTFNKASQSITFSTLPNLAIAVATSTVSASATSSLTVSFSSATTGTCTVSGSVVTLLTNGTCTINADQSGNSNYLAASTVSQSFQITTSPEGITISYTGTNFQFQHTGNLVLKVNLNGSDGLVTFYYKNSKIFHCVGIQSSSLIANCTWKPTAHGFIPITASVLPSNSAYTSITSSQLWLMIAPRSVTRGS